MRVPRHADNVIHGQVHAQSNWRRIRGPKAVATASERQMHLASLEEGAAVHVGVGPHARNKPEPVEYSGEQC